MKKPLSNEQFNEVRKTLSEIFPKDHPYSAGPGGAPEKVVTVVKSIDPRQLKGLTWLSEYYHLFIKRSGEGVSITVTNFDDEKAGN